jgi:hypothetical protein
MTLRLALAGMVALPIPWGLHRLKWSHDSLSYGRYGETRKPDGSPLRYCLLAYRLTSCQIAAMRPLVHPLATMPHAEVNGVVILCLWCFERRQHPQHARSPSPSMSKPPSERSPSTFTAAPA